MTLHQILQSDDYDDCRADLRMFYCNAILQLPIIQFSILLCERKSQIDQLQE
mgnify:CR=1 FL=1